ncbi:MAG TPA: MmgE/PrpD family protein [Gemmatimonadaceae bacterium]|jgi:2-methylcitrate dehydratase PrpD|nr:MmgE/PrpD family protein [Gemmatimonadaceae bacterium]
MSSVSRELAGVLSTTTFADLPSSAVTDTHRSILDWLGSAMAGSLEPPARMAQCVVARLGVSNESTLFASGRSSAGGAAMANGVASHILELDDIHKGSTIHGAAPIIPAALAVAEREHASGEAFLLAVTLGYEAALRIGEAVNPSHYRFWHPTGTAATFGAAVAAGSLVRLDEGQMLDALGSAGTQAAGLWEFNADGTMSKHLHPGKAALNGVLAADLAKLGFTGAATILEGDRGFFRAMSTSYDPSRITDGLGERWKVSENCYKVWACCGHTHSAVDVAGDLRSKQGWQGRDAVDRIARIAIETYGPGYEIVKEQSPGTPYEAKFSIAYCVAAALLHGGATMDVFSPDHFAGRRVADPHIAALLSRTTVTVADDLTAKYPRAWPARVTITLADGTSVHGASDYPAGNPENPVTTAQLERKFMDLVSVGWGSDAVQRAIAAVNSLVSVHDMSTVFAGFGSVAG